jgi:hypothetical protein
VRIRRPVRVRRYDDLHVADMLVLAFVQKWRAKRDLPTEA